MTDEPAHRLHPGELRASHADRDAVVERLREAAGEGRLDLTELETRIERALAAKTYAELAPLTADLPPTALPADPGRPLTLRGGWHGVARTGRWEVPAYITVHGDMGGAKLDFTAAQCRLPLVEVEVHGHMGGVKLVVPVGWRVDSDEVDRGLGGVRNKTSEERLPGTPVLRLVGGAGPGGVLVRNPSRRARRKREREERSR